MSADSIVFPFLGIFAVAALLIGVGAAVHRWSSEDAAADYSSRVYGSGEPIVIDSIRGVFHCEAAGSYPFSLVP